MASNDYYESAQDDLSYEISEIDDGIIVTCTNDGGEAANFVEGKVIFFRGSEPIYYNSNYFVDDDGELKLGNTHLKNPKITNGASNPCYIKLRIVNEASEAVGKEKEVEAGKMCLYVFRRFLVKK